MFHHFHDSKHLPAQGSLDAEIFEEMLDWLGERYNLLDATDYFDRFLDDKLSFDDICLSFDDALLCQYDVAVPILSKRGLSAFFFVYSSPFSGKPDYLEIYRFFRTSTFKDINDFYDVFSNLVRSLDASRYQIERNRFDDLDYLADFPFYTESDKWFRYLRDQVLGELRYHEIMTGLMRDYQFDIQEASKNLWMTDVHLKLLHDEGHMIGLHSYSHPTVMSKLPYEKQKEEYLKNKFHLENVLGEGRIIAMSHPCGNYNEHTLDILRDLGIQIGFRSNMGVKEIRSSLEIPREDHANVRRMMGS